MRKPNTIEDEIDKIRLAHYEKTKHMTPEQHVEYIRRKTDPIIKQYGFKMVDRVAETNDTPYLAVPNSK